MPSPVNTAELLDLIHRSGVTDVKRITAFVEALRTAGTLPTEPIRLAELLIGEGLLTRFQAEQLLQGKWKRFNIGKYKVLERLGSGGMGSVYLCEHTLMRRRVAVKVLPAAKAEDPAALERFYREARAVAALDHPNIVRAYDIDQDEKLHFLVMEHVDGASLQEIIKRSGPLEVVRACHYMRQAALGLQHAHEQAGLVHRDIKPGNILVDRNGIVKILDMGLARFFHDEEDILTRKYDENVLGTADYLAPEQALDSHTVDIRADIYSLGATFYFTLTGKPPFAEGTVAQKLMWHQTRQPRSVRQHRPEIPEAVNSILEKMMAKDPAHRFQTPLDIVEALAPWTQTPIAPPPESEMPQLSRAAMPADLTMTRQGPGSTVPSPSPRKQWQVSGAGTGSERGQPMTTPAPQPAPGPATPHPTTPVPTGPAAQRTIAPAPVAPQPVQPPAQQRAPQTIAPAPVQPAPVQPSAAARPVAPVTTAPPPAPIRPADTQPISVSQTPSPGEPDWEDVPQEGASGATSGRQRPKPRGETNLLWLWIVLGVGLLGSIIAGIFYLVFSNPVTQPPTPPVRGPVIVDTAGTDGTTLRTVYAALQKTKSGDRVILRGETAESMTFSNTDNLVLEAEADKRFIWKAPATWSGNPRIKILLDVRKAGNVTFRNITFDGANNADILISVFGHCPGLKFENCSFINFRQQGILLRNTEGDQAKPIEFTKGNIKASEKKAVGVFLDILPNPGYIPRNRFITFKDVTVEVPDAKFKTPRADMNQDVLLPEGLKMTIGN